MVRQLPHKEPVDGSIPSVTTNKYPNEVVAITDIAYIILGNLRNQYVWCRRNR